MKPTDIAAALYVSLVWGAGFVLTRLAIEEMSPILFTTLRFAIAALPCLLLPRPQLGFPVLAGISALLVLQFLAQTLGMAYGVPAGLTAVIVQSQALFTIAFAAAVFGDIPTRWQIVGVGIAACGLAMICFTVGYDFSAGAFALTMTAPISFACSNLLLRHAKGASMLHISAWAGLLTLPPLVAVMLAVDGAAATWQSLTHLSARSAACVLIVAVAGTTLGYWIWGRLLSTYSATQVVPFALLIPFVGAGASTLLFGETFGPLRLGGVLIVIGGIAVMLVAGRNRPLPEVA